MTKKTTIILFLTFILVAANAQHASVSTIHWLDDREGMPCFAEQNSYANDGRLPALLLQFDGSAYKEAICTFGNYTELSDNESEYLKSEELHSAKTVETHITYIEKKPVLEVTLMPIIFDTLDGRYKKATQYTIELIKKMDASMKTSSSTTTFKDASALNSGKWVRIRIETSGIHRISYTTLKQWGFNDPSRVAIYGNGGLMLPYYNSASRVDDLSPCTSIHQGSSILFYAQGANSYKYNANTGLFDFQNHAYEKYAYYFLTEQSGQLSPPERNYQSLAATRTITSFNDMAHYETDQYNLIRSGKQWFGERFDSNTPSRSFNFNFPQLDQSKEIYITVSAAARSSSDSRFDITLNNELLNSISINSVGLNSEEGMFANENSITQQLKATQNNLTVGLKFGSSFANALGWLDFININVHSRLTMTGSQCSFRSSETINAQTAVTFQLENANENTIVWDVTAPSSPERIVGELSQGIYRFNVPAGQLRELVAFNPDGSFPEPVFEENVANQNLHALQPVNFIILTHPKFYAQAQKLAQSHMEKQNLSIAIVTPQQIYNEFSSGSRDITAIRDFLRMLYKRTDTKDANRLKYLLLLGDGSYDNKNDNAENPNFIPTYQSANSLHQSYSYVSDDFFGYLDDEEGLSDTRDRLDIGIGRFTVQTVLQAQQAVQKSIRHMAGGTTDSWKKNLTFVGDDGDNNIHMQPANDLTKIIALRNPEYDITKIYLDSYIPSVSSSGKTYPQASTDIDRAINEGSLIFNYTGHGSTKALSHESVVNLASIQKWDNGNKLALFVTATCQFTRYDEKTETSAGEMVFLNPYGGAVALFTTTRIAYSNSNSTINTALYDYAFQRDSQDNKYAMGEIIQRTKNATGTNTYKMSFTLIGDPALPLVYPENSISTDSINGINIAEFDQPLTAMSTNTINGSIRNRQGLVINDFNGMVNITILDKPISTKTRGNEGTPFTYSNYQNIIFKGSVTVTNGRFKAEFIVPKDIQYNIGAGRISYYALDQANGTEAIGANNQILIGGISNNPVNDTTGPRVKLWLNNQSFSNGQKVSTNPILLAKINDISGINTTGIGVGHDITLFLDGDRNNPMLLNSYYETENTNYTHGTIKYQLSNLTPGKHYLELRVWDNMNNSTTTKIEFEVIENMGLILSSPTVYPNPCAVGREELKLLFGHDEYNAKLNITIQLFNLAGQLISQQKEQITAVGNSISPITVHSTGINPGLYLIKVQIQSTNGRTGTFSKKIMLIQ